MVNGLTITLQKLLRYSNLMFLNTHELADCHRKWSRRVHEIGGISFKEPKELDQEYNQLLLSGNSKFVVLVSFGTTTPSFLMPIEYKMSLMNVFSKLDHILFIWKYEKDDEFSKRVVPNVVFKKYIPQVDLLESGRISLFITHGGQNSLLETFHAGVPALVVPLFGDQHRNAQIAKEKHLATVLRKEDMANEEVVEQAIRNGIGGDEGLVSNLSELSSALRDAKSVAENLLMTTIETTYSSSHFPPNFLQSPPCSLNSNDYLLILDVAFHTLIFVIMMFLVNIIRN